MYNFTTFYEWYIFFGAFSSETKVTDLIHSSYFLSSVLGKKRNQMGKWIQQGLVPKPGLEPILGKGLLESVWLGGLANPGAFIMSLKHEKAASSGCTVEEVINAVCNGSFDRFLLNPKRPGF